jgi:hypothetical protein
MILNLIFFAVLFGLLIGFLHSDSKLNKKDFEKYWKNRSEEEVRKDSLSDAYNLALIFWKISRRQTYSARFYNYSKNLAVKTYLFVKNKFSKSE